MAGRTAGCERLPQSSRRDTGVTQSMGARSTIADVALAAGVSRATVSRVMNNQVSVNADLARRVRSVAAELGYEPSSAARSLSLGRTDTIAVVVPDLANPMFQDIIRGLTAAASIEGYQVLICETDEDPAAEPGVARQARSRCDAVALIAPSSPVETVRDLVARLDPAVVIGRELDGSAHSALAVDYAAGIETLVDHLTDLGHRELVYLSGPSTSPGNIARLKGFRRVEAKHPGLRISHLSCGSRMEDGYAAAVRVLAGQGSAVLAYNDLVAFGLLSGLNEIGVAVPQDFSVVGLDDVALARFAVPPLTTLSVPGDDLGRRGWAQLRLRIEGSSPQEETAVVPQLVVRESTGPVTVLRAPHRRRTVSSSVTELSWHPDQGNSDVLMGGEVPLLRYERGEQMPTVHAPRPYAHPIHSLEGVPLTAAGPRLHRHQHGLSLALPDVNGTSYWGGRTYLEGVGTTLLPNHGRQRVTDRAIDHGDRDRTGLSETLTWDDEYGDPWLTEERSITGSLIPELKAWKLEWRSALHASTTDLVFASPATKGRHGAGYGGIFWRFDNSPVRKVFNEAGVGEQVTHGSASSWIALVRGGQQQTTTVVLRQPGTVLPWFCRVVDYTGIGPAIAWDERRELSYGSTLTLDLEAIILDRPVNSASEVAELLARCTP